MLGAILRATNSSFQKGMTFCRSIYVKTIMKLLAFIFEQPSYQRQINVTQTKPNVVHNYPGYQYLSGRVSSICTII